MKIQLLKILLPLAILVASSGCVHVVAVKIPSEARDTSAMQVSDARQPTDDSFISTGLGRVLSSGATKQPEERTLGNLENSVVVSTDRTAAELVASIVAERYPRAAVKLTDFRGKGDQGLWANRFSAFIEAEVTVEGVTDTIRASGENLLVQPSARNFQLAFGRALEDFRRNLAASSALERAWKP